MSREVAQSSGLCRVASPFDKLRALGPFDPSTALRAGKLRAERKTKLKAALGLRQGFAPQASRRTPK